MSMAMRTFAALMVAAGLATACGGSNTAANSSAGNAATVTGNTVSSNAQQAVRDLPDGQRAGVMLRAIRDARQPCQNVVEAPASSAPNATPVYLATCEDGAVYAVAIQDDGTAIVQPAMPAEGKAGGTAK